MQGQLTDEQWNDVITPGTELYHHWCAQVDVIAGYLEQLQAARIPVLWRPYHEMNGNWFWWGGRGGERGTAALYRQLFDRLVNYHHLNNLVWIWSVDRPGANAGPFADFFPGKTYFDIAALDVYHGDFQQSYYNDLLKLAAGKPVTLAEVGPAPTPAILEQQPKWAWWMLWAVEARRMMVTANSPMRAMVNDPRSLSRDDQNTSRASRPSAPLPGWCRCPPQPKMRHDQESALDCHSGRFTQGTCGQTVICHRWLTKPNAPRKLLPQTEVRNSSERKMPTQPNSIILAQSSGAGSNPNLGN